MANGKARTLCIDATNLLRVCYGHAGEAFRKQEDADGERLVAILDRLAEQGAGTLQIEAVFDGPARPWRASAGNVRVRFAGGEASDELIMDRVRLARHAGRGRVTVVTGDGELGRRVQDEGGRWVAVRPADSLEAVLASLGRGARA